VICRYQDQVTFVRFTIDEYDTERILDTTTVPAIIEHNTGWAHGNNQDIITSDAIIRPDPENAFVKANYHRLEEMLVITRPYGDPEHEAWYRVISVTTFKRPLLCNDVDNIEIALKKSTEPLSVS